MRPLWLVLICVSALANEAIFPKGANPLGPYSPGVLTTEHLYVSGQAGGPANGDADAQVTKVVDSIEAILQGGQLTLEHVVFMEIYVTEAALQANVEKVLAARFRQGIPARITVIAARLPGNNAVEINAIAVRDLSKKRAVLAAGTPAAQPPLVATIGNDRAYLMASYASARQPGSAVQSLRRNLRRTGAAESDLLHLTIFFVEGLRPPLGSMEALAKRSGAPVVAIPVKALPGGAAIGVTGIVATTKKGLEKPAGGCRRFNATLYCKSDNSGEVPDVAKAVGVALDDQLGEQLKSNGYAMNDVVAAHVLVSDLDQFAAMNAEYVKRFTAVRPSRTTLQPAFNNQSTMRVWTISEK